VILAPKCLKKIEFVKKDISYCKEIERLDVNKEYLRSLRSNGKICGLEDPMYMKKDKNNPMGDSI
jgi:hypothetical protein